MSWTLNGSPIRAPHDKKITENVRKVIHEPLSGGFVRDFIGSRKKIIDCKWSPMFPDDYTTLFEAFTSQELTATTYILEISEIGFSAEVLIDFDSYSLPYPNNYDLREISVRFYEV
jgi:hypothetical protein